MSRYLYGIVLNFQSPLTGGFFYVKMKKGVDYEIL